MNENTAERFIIDDDKKADWAVKKIAEETAERDRLIGIAKAEIAELQEKVQKLETEYEDKINYFKYLLVDYFYTVERKETKTKETYKLLNGTLVMKKARQEIKHEDEALLDYFRKSGRQEFIKVTEKPNWAEFKKGLEIVDGVVLDASTGEAINCLTVEVMPAEFTVTV